jgi:cell division protein ZapA
LSAHIGRMPEARMLLMAGLMLADKTAGLEDRVREADARIEELSIRVAEASARGVPAPERIEVPVIPAHVTETLAEIAARAEALAAMVEERLG